MKSIADALSRDLGALLMCVIVAFLLRGFQLDLMEFKHDEAIAFGHAILAGKTGHLPQHGLISSTGVENFPLFLYVVIILHWIAKSPLGIVWIIAALNSLAAVFVYYSAKRMVGEKAALVGALFYSVSPCAVSFSRKLWAQDLMPFWACAVFFFFGYLCCTPPEQRKRFLLTFFLFFFLTTSFQIHFSGAVLCVSVAVLALALRTKFDVKGLAAGVLVGGLPSIPYWVFQFGNHWQGVTALLAGSGGHAFFPLRKLASFAVGQVHDADFPYLFGQDYRALLAIVPGYYWLRHVLSLIVLVGIVYCLVRIRRDGTERKKWIVLIGYLLIPMVIFGVLRAGIIASYFIITYPAPFILCGVGIIAIVDWLRKFMKPVYATGMLAAFLLVVCAYQIVYYAGANHWLTIHGGTRGLYEIPFRFKRQAIGWAESHYPKNQLLPFYGDTALCVLDMAAKVKRGRISAAPADKVPFLINTLRYGTPGIGASNSSAYLSPSIAGVIIAREKLARFQEAYPFASLTKGEYAEYAGMVNWWRAMAAPVSERGMELEGAEGTFDSGGASEKQVHRLIVGELKTNCYVLMQKRQNECIVLDPGADAESIMEFVASKGLIITGIVATHGHYDHVGGCGGIQKETHVPVWIHAADLQMALSYCRDVRFRVIDQEGLLKIGGFELEALRTPGHTSGSLCIRWGKNLFTGDTLFLLGVGMCDAPEELAEVVRTKLWRLDDDTKVYPGHGEFSSIGFEKRYNPYVAAAPERRCPVAWIESFGDASRQARQKGKILLLLLTVKQWPCARDYCERLFLNSRVSGLARETINCLVDVQKEPGLKEQYGVTQLPAIVFLDAEGNVVDVLAQAPIEVVEDVFSRIVGGERPAEKFAECEKRSQKSAGDFLYMGRYALERNATDKALFYLYQGCAAPDAKPAIAIEIEEAILKAYRQKSDIDKALEAVDRLEELSRRTGIGKRGDYELIRAVLLYEKKRYAECLSCTESYIGSHGGERGIGQAMLLRGYCYLGQNEYEQAIEAFDEAAKNGDEAVIAKSLFSEGCCYLMEQKYGEARRCFSAIAQDYPQSEEAEGAARYLQKLGGLD